MTARWTRGEFGILAMVVLSAVVLRIGYLAALADTPFFDHLFVNSEKYDGWARDGVPGDEPYYQAPLYIYFLRAVYTLASDEGRFLAIRVVQLLLGTATAALTYLSARRLAGRGAAAVAGFLTAAAGPLIYFDGEILPTSLGTCLLAGATYLTIRLETTAAPAAREWIGPGLAIGIASTCRPNFLALAVVLVGVVAWRAWRARSTTSSAWAAPILFLLAGLTPPVLGVAVANLSAGQGFVLLTSNSGYNLLLGHNAGSDGMNPFPPPGVKQLSREWRADGLTAVEQSRLASREARRYLREHPGRSLALWWKRGVLCYHRAEIPNNRSIRWQVEHSRILRWPPAGWIGLGLLFPLAAIGAVLGHRRRGVFTPVLPWLLITPLSLAPFLICARFRAPVIPLLALLAAVAVVELRGRPSRPRLVVAGVAGILALLLSWPAWWGVGQSEFPSLALNRAQLFLQTDDARWRDEARLLLEEVAQEHPREALARLGDYYRIHALDLEGAERSYRRAIENDATDARACYGLAVTLIEQGKKDSSVARARVEEAERWYRRAIELDPLDPDVHWSYAELLHFLKRYDESVVELRAYLDTTVRGEARFRQIATARIAIGESERARQRGDSDVAAQKRGEARRIATVVATSGDRATAIAIIGDLLRLPLPAEEKAAIEGDRRRLGAPGTGTSRP